MQVVEIKQGHHFGIQIGDEKYVRFRDDSWWMFSSTKKSFRWVSNPATVERLEELFKAITTGDTWQ